LALIASVWGAWLQMFLGSDVLFGPGFIFRFIFL
jgi:hypothetical protein